MAPNPTPLRIAVAGSGRTQRDIAQAVGLNDKDMSLLVNGRRPGDDDTRSAIAKELGRTVEDLWPAPAQAAA